MSSLWDSSSLSLATEIVRRTRSRSGRAVAKELGISHETFSRWRRAVDKKRRKDGELERVADFSEKVRASAVAFLERTTSHQTSAEDRAALVMAIQKIEGVLSELRGLLPPESRKDLAADEVHGRRTGRAGVKTPRTRKGGTRDG